MQPNFNIKNIKLIIGLGNPGTIYKDTYHNAGFLFVDYLTKTQPSLNSQPLAPALIKSAVYMNESGNFVKKIIKESKTKPRELLIVHDDADIPLGKYKFSFGSGSAGHKGVESIIKALGTKDFWRLRIGIRKQELGIRQKAENFVLKKVSRTNKKILENLFEQITKSF